MSRIFATSPPQFPVPHPPLPLPFWLIAEEAIRLAWVRLRQRAIDGFNLATADEDAITLKLHEILIDEIYQSGQVPGFDDALMQIGYREAKIRNFNGQHPDKMPDLHISIISRQGIRRTQDGIFVECKPVDADHTTGVHYCDKGILRFVRGDYAWAMTAAMMVAYAKGGYTIDPKLTDALGRSSTIATVSMPTQCASSVAVLFSVPTQITVHSRNFRYTETGKDAPDIAIRHLWLNR